MNKGLTDTLKSHFPNITPVVRPTISLPDILEAYWVVGFCDGESNFDIKISQNKNYSTGHQVQLRFRVSQHTKDLLLLTKFIDFFNCGYIEKFQTNPAAIFVVSRLTDLNTSSTSTTHYYFL
jgi:hypothetical protein